MFRKRLIKIGLLAVAILLVASLISFIPARVSITGEGNLSLDTRVALAINNPPVSEVTSSTRQQFGETVVVLEPWGYLYTLENGDIVEVGDSTTTDFKAHVKTIRWNGVADFSLWLEGGTFTPILTDTTISFDFNNNFSIEIYPVPPCKRLPEGGIEYDITLHKRPTKSTFTFNSDWTNVEWTKILPLDEEYDQAACEEEWGVELAPFTLTPTSITSDVTSDVLMTRAEYEVNSYIGVATTNWHNTSDIGGGVTYSTVSRSYLHVHRGEMTDSLGAKAWTEDITLDEVAKEFTFTLPKTWLKSASYPVSHVCGLDPAYTEDMDSWVTGTYGDADNTWSDYDLFTNKGVPKGAVAEIIIEQVEVGTEMNMGIRTDGSGLARYVEMHECEGGGFTHVRMFVVCHADTGLVETFCEDVTDAMLFYVVGYWENVSFTERWDVETPSASGAWDEEALVAGAGAASKVCHFLLRNQEQDTDNLMGVRDTSSAVNRYILVHEPEAGGESILDVITKSDSSQLVDFYTEDNGNTVITCAGYFGEELDFVEGFDVLNPTANGWTLKDVSAYLDQDGRVTDWLLVHSAINSVRSLGVRDGDDVATARIFVEHEAEDNGSATGEETGFGISAKSEAAVGKVYQGVGISRASSNFYLMGYFKPTAVGEPAAEVTPTTWAVGIIAVNTTANTLINHFTVENTGAGAIDIEIKGTDFTGGDDTWTLSDTGSAGIGENIFALYAGLDDEDDLFDIIIKKTAAYNTLVASLAEDATQDWGMKLYMPTSITDYDGQQMTCTVTLIVSAS